MIARGPRARSGITLTEILIAILIMGVGLISLATLFPLGLLRLREASRNSRAGLAFETAADDMDTRGLFFKPNFSTTWYGTIDPFTQDIDGFGNSTNMVSCANVALDSGLPICYDPLWRALTAVAPRTGFALYDQTLDFQPSYLGANPSRDEARFGAGLFATGNGYAAPFIAPDPDGGNPSAYGLQRITNFIPWSSAGRTPRYPFTTNPFNNPNQPSDVAGNVFTSIDDIVFNPTGGNATAPSSVLPDMSVNNTPQVDYKYTWFVTGKQTDATNGTQFNGDIVICDGRPFGFDPLPGQSFNAPAGETAVEAIFGVGTPPGGVTNFANSDRSVFLRWSAALPDPQVRVGGWICDVTYERDPLTYHKRAFSTTANPNGANNTTKFDSPFVRCNWYQIGKRTDPLPDSTLAGYRSMTVTITSKLKAQTLLNPDGTPLNRNVALVMPSVIRVIPRAFEVH